MSTLHQTNWPRAPQGVIASPQRLWRALWHWFRVNTFTPAWLGKRWNHPLVGIATAILLQIIVLVLRQLVADLFPQAVFYSVLSLLVVALTALSWGAGPSVISTLIGVLALDLFILPPRLLLKFDSAPVMIGALAYLLAGFAISALASQTERARRSAQSLAGSLEQERARLETILETIPDAVVLYDANGSLLWLNRMGRQLGKAAPIHQPLEETSELYSMHTPSGDLLPPEHVPLARALRGETVTATEIHYRGAEGQERLVSVSAAPLYDARGRVENVVVVSHDISTLRQAERDAAQRANELEVGSNLLEAVIEAITDGVFVYDAAGRARQINSAGRAFLRMYASGTDDPSTPVEDRVSEFIAYDESGHLLAPEQYPSVRISRGEVLNGATAVDMIIPTLDGGRLQLNLSGAPFKDASGQQSGAVVVARDVTERRQLARHTQEALEALLLMAEALVQVPQAAALDEAAAGAAAHNEAARRLVELTRRVLGCQRASIVAVEPEAGRQRLIATTGLPPEEEARWWAEQPQTPFGTNSEPALAQRLLAGEIVVLNAADPPSQGRPNSYGIQTLLAAPIRLGERLVGVLALDYGGAPHSFTREELALAAAVSQLGALVLERERMLRERAEAEAQMLALQETNRRMDEFLGIISHELRTPVTSIKTGIQLMLKRSINRAADEHTSPETLVKTLKDQEHNLQRTDVQMRRLTRLLDDLIDVSRIRMERLELETAPCDLGALVRDVVEEEQFNHPDRVISLEGTAHMPILVEADPDRLGQVLTNFLTNALKYSLFDRPVWVGAAIEGQQGRVWVRDQGPGIPLEQQAHIWDIFHRVPGIEVQTGSGIGLGLGLHISKVMIEQQHGAVGVKSTPGEGSTFWFTLPLLDAAAE